MFRSLPMLLPHESSYVHQDGSESEEINGIIYFSRSPGNDDTIILLWDFTLHLTTENKKKFETTVSCVEEDGNDFRYWTSCNIFAEIESDKTLAWNTRRLI